MAKLIAAGADVPRLGNHFAGGQHRVLINGLEQAAVALESRFASQNGAQIEAEAVDVKFFYPIAQAVHQPAGDIAVGQLQGVAGAAPIAVSTVWLLPIPSGVVDTALAEHQADSTVLLGGVVVHHIQQHFDTGGVQGAHGGTQFVGSAGGICGISGLDCKM